MTTAYVNGEIYTVDPTRPWASVLLVRDGSIIAVGGDDALRDQIRAADEVVDLEGWMVMPGIHDAHIHLLSGLGEHEVSFPADADEAGIVAALQAWTGPLPRDRHGNAWLVGGRYWPERLAPGGPSKDFLDSAFPDTPVLLNDRSAHSALVNSRALALAGIDETTRAGSNGEVVLDETGTPTGELIEQARWPVIAVMGQHAPDVVVDAVTGAMRLCHRYGVTSVQDASSAPHLLQALRTMDDAGALRLHVAAHLVWREVAFGAADLTDLDALIDDHAAWESAHVDPSFVKIWLDGAPIPPYFTHSCLHHDGSVDEKHLLVPRDELTAALARFTAAGLSVKMHAAGEGAVRAGLDAVEHARAGSRNGSRHELAHCGKVDDADLPRFRALNVGAEVSPAVWHRPEHGVHHDYRFRDLVDAGAELTVGTDWSVTETPDPFPGMQGILEHGDQSLDLATALSAYTLAGARAVGRQATRGSLSPGKLADFIVLDRNLFNVETRDIGATTVLRTVVEGRSVHQA